MSKSEHTATFRNAGAINRAKGKASRRAALVGLTASAAVLGALSFLPRRPALVWNFTPSIPVGLYLIDDAAPAPGDIIALAAASSVSIASSVLARDRMLLKPVAAQGGDTVCRNGSVVSINSAIMAEARSHMSDGQTLPRWSGCRRLAPDELFLLSQHPASFDSRYFGPVRSSDVVGVLRPLLTFPLSREAGS